MCDVYYVRAVISSGVLVIGCRMGSRDLIEDIQKDTSKYIHIFSFQSFISATQRSTEMTSPGLFFLQDTKPSNARFNIFLKDFIFQRNIIICMIFLYCMTFDSSLAWHRLETGASVRSRCKGTTETHQLRCYICRCKANNN